MYPAVFSIQLFWLHGKEGDLWSCCTVHSSVFCPSKFTPGTSSSSASHFHVFFLSIPPSVLLFWVNSTLLKHITSLSTMFVYVYVPPNNPIKVHTPSLGFRPTLKVKVFAWSSFGDQFFWFRETFFTNQVANFKILGAMATKMVTTWRVAGYHSFLKWAISCLPED